MVARTHKDAAALKAQQENKRGFTAHVLYYGLFSGCVRAICLFEAFVLYVARAGH